MARLSFRLLPPACLTYQLDTTCGLVPNTRGFFFGLGPRILSKATDITPNLFVCLGALSNFRDI